MENDLTIDLKELKWKGGSSWLRIGTRSGLL
jgi:hypothetical protein